MPAVVTILFLLAALAAPDPPWRSFEDALDTGRQEQRKVLVSVTASWCPWCARLDRTVYADPEVQAYLAEHFVIGRLQHDGREPVTYRRQSAPPAAVAYALGAEGVPGTVFFDERGDYVTVFPGYADKAEFLQVLRFIAEDAYRHESFEDFAARGG